MAARRGKHQARRNSGNGLPGWVWLIAGLVLGVALFLTVPGLLKRDGDGFFRPQPDPDARPAPVADADTDAAAPIAPAGPAPETAPKETQYAFYDLLPGREVRMSDAELAATAREEAARGQRQPAAVAGEPANPDAADPAVPPAANAADTPAANAAAAAAAAARAGDANTRYILQAGAFGGSGDAEAVKAKIAMLGLSARVESAQISGRTVYRVRMGPYGTAGELAEAKRKLADGGLPAMAIRAQ